MKNLNDTRQEEKRILEETLAEHQKMVKEKVEEEILHSTAYVWLG